MTLGSVLLLALFFPLRFVLAIWGHLCFHINEWEKKFFFYCFYEECHWNFIKDCVGSIGGFGRHGHFNNINYYTHEQEISFLLCLLQFFSTKSCSFHHIHHSLPQLNLCFFFVFFLFFYLFFYFFLFFFKIYVYVSCFLCYSEWDSF